MRRAGPLGLLLALLAGPAPAAAPGTGAEEYDALQQWRFGPRRELPAEGFSFARDTASWRLLEGRIRLQEPTADGAVAGLLFEGRGRFVMEVPDPVELRQLRRFAADPELQRLEVELDTLIVRASSPDLLSALAGGGPYRPHPLVAKRHESWLRDGLTDVDSRIVGARRCAGDELLWVEMRTADHGWLTWVYDALRHEEIELWRWNRAFARRESWVSLDRPEDRSPGGRPGPRGEPPFDLRHADVEARLLELGRDPGLSTTQAVTLEGGFRAVLDLTARRAGQGALQMSLLPMAEVTAVHDGDGRPLPWLRDATGRRFRTMDRRVHSPGLAVLLPREPAVGERVRLVVEYRLDVRNYVPGRFWYPAVGLVEPVLLDPHTLDLEVAIRDAYRVRAMGEAGEERVADGVRTNRWRITRPVRMATFAFARRMVEESVAEPGLPEVVAFSPPLGSATAARLERIAGEVAEALAFFTELLDAPVEGPRLYVTMIQAAHGQAFEGFLHLAEESAYRPRTGPSERFHAHEVAHLWWGHRVAWSGYRDQWLSEGLSNYLALLFLEARHRRGQELYGEAIEVYTRQTLGSMGSSMSPFARSEIALGNMRGGDRIGPIGHGVRAAVGEAPSAFRSQSYDRAVLALHSLRRELRIRTGDDAAFTAILRDLVRAHDGGQIATVDFADAVSRHSSVDGARWVDQWIHTAAIPTWRWRLTTPAGGSRVEIVVEQSGVADGFRSAVPLRVEYADGGREERLVEVAGPRTVITLELAGPPRAVELNPDYAVLARMKPL